MAKFTVTAPTKVTGVIAGVTFVEGIAIVDNDTSERRRALAYFRRRDGYTVEPVKVESVRSEPQGSKRPAQSASKADWVTWVVNHPDVSQRLTQADAEALSKEALIERYGRD